MEKRNSQKAIWNWLGKFWASPYTLLGLAYGLLGFVLGQLMRRRLRPRICLGNNALQFLDNPLTIPFAAITLGNTISYGRGTHPNHWGAYGDRTVHLGRHEEAHTWQYQALGPFFIPIYFLCGGVVGPARNPLERAAQDFGRGTGSWWPW